ncbi:hypothetical protein [Pelagibius sp.]|uniref:hypothetical protein n=1 Tax=Pelagibius sp. TaxID=1931238 RepID=UPI003B503677
MITRVQISALTIGALMLLGTTGCATNEQVEALRAEIAAAQDMAANAMARADEAHDLASQADAKADAASAAAEAAMAEARAARSAAEAADAKAERIYTESLRK